MSKYRSISEQLPQIFKALGNPSRFALFHRLTQCCRPGTRCEVGEAIRYTVGELGEGMSIAPSTLSHHLKELHIAGLIKMERQGKQVLCWIDPEVLDQLADFFSHPQESNRSVEVPCPNKIEPIPSK